MIYQNDNADINTKEVKLEHIEDGFKEDEKQFKHLSPEERFVLHQIARIIKQPLK